jgi:hypothetical protein
VNARPELGQSLTSALIPVPIVDGKAIIAVEGIPEGDDYFAIFMDSYDGTVRLLPFRPSTS